ncbi:hypothetical protein FGB62_52g01 [Gracilaria domingensis]|nr:hypothetical protein FGB62_52g01 [Gracilaria domingensis]
MESATDDQANAGYESIPTTAGVSASSAQTLSGGVSGRVNSSSYFRRLRSFVVMGVIASVSVFYAGRAGLIERCNHFRNAHVFPTLSEAYRDIGHFNTGASYASRVNAYKTGFNGFIRSDSCSTVEDFSLDERVPTRQCSAYRFCRARLTVLKEGAQVVIKAGYYIFRERGKALTVDAKTKKRVKNTTPAQARKWAASLLSGASARLDEVGCTLSVDKIAEAILEAKDEVVSCPKTDDPRCSVLLTIGECTVADSSASNGGTEEEEECLQFVESSEGVESLTELQAGCPSAQFVYNRVGVSLPFCETSCDSPDPCAKHTVYMDFYVQSNRLGNTPGDCLSASLIPAYKSLYSTVPACDSVTPAWIDEGRVLVSVADVYQGTVPQELLNLAKQHGCELTYAFFVKNGMSLQEIVDGSCAAL